MPTFKEDKQTVDGLGNMCGMMFNTIYSLRRTLKEAEDAMEGAIPNGPFAARLFESLAKDKSVVVPVCAIPRRGVAKLALDGFEKHYFSFNVAFCEKVKEGFTEEWKEPIHIAIGFDGAEYGCTLVGEDKGVWMEGLGVWSILDNDYTIEIADECKWLEDDSFRASTYNHMVTNAARFHAMARTMNLGFDAKTLYEMAGMSWKKKTFELNEDVEFEVDQDAEDSTPTDIVRVYNVKFVTIFPKKKKKNPFNALAAAVGVPAAPRAAGAGAGAGSAASMDKKTKKVNGKVGPRANKRQRTAE
jgi:hypothetical protein